MLLVHCQNDLEGFGIAELHHHLSAYSAGSCIFCKNALFSAYYADCLEFLNAFAYSLEKGGSLRAVGGGVACVFNVAAGVGLTIFCQQGCAYFKIGIWCIRILQLRYGSID